MRSMVTPRSGSVRRSCLCCFSKEVALYWTNLGGDTCPLWFADSSSAPHIPASQRLNFSGGAQSGVSPMLESERWLSSGKRLGHCFLINKHLSGIYYYSMRGTVLGAEGRAVNERNNPNPQGARTELFPIPNLSLTCSGQRGRWWTWGRRECQGGYCSTWLGRPLQIWEHNGSFKKLLWKSKEKSIKLQLVARIYTTQKDWKHDNINRLLMVSINLMVAINQKPTKYIQRTKRKEPQQNIKNQETTREERNRDEYKNNQNKQTEWQYVHT